jgi:hypothetical protein
VARLRKTIQFDASDEKGRGTAQEAMSAFLGSGVIEGPATLIVEFEAPTLEAMRKKRDTGEDGPAEDRPKRSRKTKAGADAI